MSPPSLPAAPPTASAVSALYGRIEERLDGPFGACNPLRHLGALGFLFLWIAVGTGIYLYAVLDTSVAQIHASIDARSREPLSALLRSLHRYSADALMLVMLLHLARETVLGRFRGFRWFSWVSGVPLLWLVYAAGIGGFWIVWDRLAQFSAIATAEWLDWLPIFADPMTRNFLFPGAVSDRFFSLLVFVHIGVPLLLLLGLWLHVQRVSRAEVWPPRALAWGSAAMLVALSLARPVVSDAPADLALFAQPREFDWFFLLPHALMYESSPAALWALAAGVTMALLAPPLWRPAARAPVAQVVPEQCNGCRRCLDDCPYEAIEMVPHGTRQLAQVSAARCAACGICAGACPSSTPFRRGETLTTGIDMPQLPVSDLRRRLEAGLAGGARPVVMFGCACGADAQSVSGPGTLVLPLLCAAQLPPAFVEYALRAGAAGVMVASCRPGGCAFRLGDAWIAGRLGGTREPHLRATVDPRRVKLVFAGPRDAGLLSAALDAFRREIAGLAPVRGMPARRMTNA